MDISVPSHTALASTLLWFAGTFLLLFALVSPSYSVYPKPTGIAAALPQIMLV
ncbi:MAG: hypothetical protein ACM3ZT_08695 [Bacillota bacterium]